MNGLPGSMDDYFAGQFLSLKAEIQTAPCYFAHPKRKLVHHGSLADGQHAQIAKNSAMAPWTREDLLAFLNQMLEAERAGARALMHVAKDTKHEDVAALAGAIQKDEARWCAMLIGQIKKLDAAPSEKTGAFYDKVMALDDDKERLALVNRGQDWVVRKLKEALPRIGDADLVRELTVMLTSHEENIAAVADSGLIG